VHALPKARTAQDPLLESRHYLVARLVTVTVTRIRGRGGEGEVADARFDCSIGRRGRIGLFPLAAYTRRRLSISGEEGGKKKEEKRERERERREYQISLSFFLFSTSPARVQLKRSTATIEWGKNRLGISVARSTAPRITSALRSTHC
jgi:hypothetical protein